MHVNVKKKKKESISHPSLRLRLLLFRPGARSQRMTARDRCDLDRIAHSSSHSHSHSLLSGSMLIECRTRSRTRTRHGMANSAIPRLARGQVTFVTTPRSLATRPLAAVANPRLTPSLLRLPSPIPIPIRTRTLQIRTGRRLRTPTQLRLVVRVVVTASQITGRLGWATTGTIRGVEGVVPGGLRESRRMTVLFFVDVWGEMKRRDLCALLVLAIMTRTTMTTTPTTGPCSGLRPPPLFRVGRLLPHRL